MTTQNPYQAPQADVAEPVVRDTGIEQVASAQKLIIYAILGYFVAVALHALLGHRQVARGRLSGGSAWRVALKRGHQVKPS